MFPSIELPVISSASIIGTPDPLPFGDKVVGIVMNRDGSVLDKIHNIVE